MYNVNAGTGERDYLSAGDSALPLIFFISTASFGIMGMFWLYICHKSSEFVHHVHMLMLILVGLKMMASLFRGVSYYSLQQHGYSVGWNVIFYIFTFLRGTMLFSVIMLIGTGWSLLKVCLIRIRVNHPNFVYFAPPHPPTDYVFLLFWGEVGACSKFDRVTDTLCFFGHTTNYFK